MSDSHLETFIRAVEADDRAVFLGPDAQGHRLLAEYRGLRFDPPLVLDFSEEEFESALHATARGGGRSLWPDVSEPEAGIRLMLVHLQESLTGMTQPSRRVYIADGPLWAE